MKILVFGKTGQLAQELRRRNGPDLTLEFLGRDQADFSRPETCLHWVKSTDADAVINAVAYTSVDRAEENEPMALTVNGTTPTALAQLAAKRGIPFVHVSTDYVFDGAGESAVEPDHPTAPLGAYGRTKLAGEEGVRGAGGAYVVLRTSWVVSAHGNNFVKTMLRLGRENDSLRIVADQVGGPTPAADLADACLAAARALKEGWAGAKGIHHVAGAPDVSWAGFAREIFAQAGINCVIEEIPTSAYPTPAQRPLNSRLDCTSLTSVLGVPRPNWKIGLTAILKELGELRS